MKKNALVIGVIAVVCMSCDAFAERDEIGFARALANYGYSDHAGEIIQKAQGKVPPSELERAKAAILKSIASDMIVRREESAKIVTAIDAAILSFENLIKTYATVSEGISNEMDIAELHEWKASQAYKIYCDSTTAALKDKWFEECESSYEKSRQYNAVVTEKLFVNAPFPDNHPDFRPYMMSRYNIISLLYKQSSIYPDGGPNARKLCEKALECVSEFVWDYDSYIIMNYVRVIEAMCQYRLGKAEDAVLTMQGVFALESDAQLYKHPAAKDIIIHAYRSKLDVLLKFAEKDSAQCNEVIKTVDALMSYVDRLVAEKAFPGLDREGPVVYMRLDRAVAKYRLGDIETAINEMSDIAKISAMWDRYIGYRLSKPDIKVDGDSEPAILKGKIDGSMISVDYSEAFLYCMYLARSKKLNDKNKEEYMPYVFRKIADIYAAREQYYESAVALEMVYKIFGKRYHLSADAELYNAAMLFLKENAFCENAYDQKRSEEILKYLAANYPQSPYTANTPFPSAKSLESQGKHIEAAAVYAKVDRSSDNYEEALARIGYCYYHHYKKIGKNAGLADRKKFLDEALKAFNKYLDFARENPVFGSKDTAERKNLMFSCNYSIADIYIDDNIARYGDAVKLFVNIDKEYPDEGDKISRAWLKTIEAYLKMRDYDNAGALMDTARRKYPAAPRLGYILKLAGSAFDQSGTELMDKGDKEAGINRIVRGRNYLYNWFEIYSAKREKIETGDLIALADKLFIMAREFMTDAENKKEQFRRAIGIYDSVLAMAGLDAGTELDLKWKIGEADCQSGDYDKAEEIFEDLLKKNGRDGAVMTKLIDVYAAIARNSESPTAHPGFDKALDLCAQVLSGIDKEAKADLWWDIKVKQHEILLEQGKYETIVSSLALLVNYNAGWEKLAVAGRITKLIEELRKKGIRFP
ncbi:MAG: outer membrane protein assembly factor BamD [Planctomycetes bacterium]|nr:outer membrane protein assembly factor BamD [Planctomycetota bacterium]